MIRQTGGSAFGETSTKSSSASSASTIADAVSTTPFCSPSASINLTWGTVISPFNLTSRLPAAMASSS